MIEKLIGGAYLVNGETLVTDEAALDAMGIRTTKEEAKNNTMAWSILSAHNTSDNAAQLKSSLMRWHLTISPMSVSSRRHVPAV